MLAQVNYSRIPRIFLRMIPAAGVNPVCRVLAPAPNSATYDRTEEWTANPFPVYLFGVLGPKRERVGGKTAIGLRVQDGQVRSETW